MKTGLQPEVSSLPPGKAMWMLIGIGAALASEIAAVLSLAFLSSQGLFSLTLTSGEGLYLVAAPLSGLLAGLLNWWLSIVRPRRATVRRGVLFGGISSVIAHPLMWESVALLSSQVWGPTLPSTGSESLLYERTTRTLYKNGEEAMPMIRLETHIQAPVERCFDLSLSVDLHRLSAVQAHERPIAGVTAGVMKLGDTVTWEAVHFGIKQHLTSKITTYERPHRFIDEMVRGAFQEMKHIHEFVPQPRGTLLIDTFTFRAPLGLLGRLAETLVLTRYMKGLLLTRNRYLKQIAEADTNALLL